MPALPRAPLTVGAGDAPAAGTVRAWTGRRGSGTVGAMKRSLTLKSETLVELAPADLAAIAGGVPPTRLCPTAQITCMATMVVERVTDIVGPLEP